MGYEYEIICRLGRDNTVADALFMCHNNSSLNVMHVASMGVWDDIRQASKSDDYVQHTKSQVNSPFNINLLWRDELLFYKGHMVIPNDGSLRSQLLYELHNSKMGGHLGVIRTCQRLRQQFHWPSMI